MKNITLSLILVSLLVLVAGLALASGGAEQARVVLSSGASHTSSGDLALRATLGQPLVGLVSGGDVTLGQGFWHGGAPGDTCEIYLPVVFGNFKDDTIEFINRGGS